MIYAAQAHLAERRCEVPEALGSIPRSSTDLISLVVRARLISTFEEGSIPSRSTMLDEKTLAMLEKMFGKHRRYYRRVFGFYVRVPRWWFE